jgi:choline transport protein
MSSYCISVGCVLYQRIANPQELPPSVWTLGRWGLPINAMGFMYSLFTLIWIAWPETPNPTRETFNWWSVMFVGVLIISFGFYITTGRKTYSGPVVLVRKL